MPDRATTLANRFGHVLDAGDLEIVAEGIPELDVTTPVVALYPREKEQIVAALKIATEEQATLVPVGNGSALHLGNLPSSVEAVMSLRHLSETVDFEPKDLTAIVQAGKSLASLQEELAVEGQFLALDPPNADKGTIGGIVATNGNGPLRRAYGTPRDLVLGVQFALSEGTIVKGGGRVVKNVAGYDTTRLIVGSMGTLGVILEASFRLHPLPEAEGAVLGCFHTWPETISAANQLVHSELQPSFLELLNAGDPCWKEERAPGFAPSVLIAFSGLGETVEYQVRRAHAILKDAQARQLELIGSEGTARWHSRLAEVVYDAHQDAKALTVRVGTIMSSVLAALENAVQLAEAYGMGVQSIAHYSNGVVIHLFRPTPPAEAAVGLVGRLRNEMAGLEGHVVVESAPGEVKRRLDVWGPPTGPLNWMRQVKDRLDPHHLLNRGRFLRGLDDNR